MHNEINKEIIEELQHRKDAFGNKILYEMCKNNPLHNDDEVISGKVWLIGRSYAVAIERVREKKYINDDFYSIEVPKIFTKNYDGNFDGDIQSIKDNGIEKILSTHKKLTDAIKHATGLEKRSFSSKYLHFHRPNIFYIYDSRASDSIHKIIKGSKELFNEFKGRRKELRGKYDIRYTEFFIKCLILRKHIKSEFGIELSPRHIDDFLIYISNKNLRIRNKNNTY